MNVLPPGGYRYEQPETGMKFDGNTLFRAQCRSILTHRKANNLARATEEEVEADLMVFTCQRVPGVCTNGADLAKLSAMPRKVRRCGSCGGRKAKK